MKVFGKSLKSRLQLAIPASVLALGSASSAMAGGGGGGPPSMPAIEFPVDIASVASAIAVAGGLILLAVFGVAVGFALAKKLMRRIKGAV